MMLLRLSTAYECVVRRRLNRFVVEVMVGDRTDAAYITNTGRLHEYIVSGAKGYCLPKYSGRLRHWLIAVEDHGGAALIDTRLQLRGFEEAAGRGLLPWLRGCVLRRRNPRLGSSVLDYLALCTGDEALWIEVKSAAMRGTGNQAMYPDCPTLRGRRHIEELIKASIQGLRTMLVFIAAIPGVAGFRPYREGDPVVARLLVMAVEAGVELKALAMHYDPSTDAIVLDNPDLPVLIE